MRRPRATQRPSETPWPADPALRSRSRVWSLCRPLLNLPLRSAPPATFPRPPSACRTPTPASVPASQTQPHAASCPSHLSPRCFLLLEVARPSVRPLGAGPLLSPLMPRPGPRLPHPFDGDTRLGSRPCPDPLATLLSMAGRVTFLRRSYDPVTPPPGGNPSVTPCDPRSLDGPVRPAKSFNRLALCS